MRIDSSTTSVFGVQPLNKPQKTDSSRYQKPVGDLQSPFSVQLSNMVEKLAGVSPSSGEIRTEKVAEISQKLQNGSYSISGNDVAAKMLLALTP